MDIFPVYPIRGLFRLNLGIHIKNCHPPSLYTKHMSIMDTCGGIHESIYICLSTFISFINASVKKNRQAFTRTVEQLLSLPCSGSTSDGILATYLTGGEEWVLLQE
jgi:hypothetical protein